MSANNLAQQVSYKLMLKDYPDVLNIEQMCGVLGISTKTGYKLLKDGKLIFIRVGRSYRIPKSSLFSYLKILGWNC